MFNGKLQPRRTVLAVSLLFIWVMAPAWAALGGQAGHAPAATPPSTNKEKTQGSAPSPEVVPPQAPASGQASKEAPAKTASAESLRVPRTSTWANAAGRRDPFQPPPVATPGSYVVAGETAAALVPGPRGLVISELRVEGIVREETENAMIAVVTNRTRRAYFLRVNDTVHNGAVSKITPEAVYFRENALDSSGRVATREVVLKLGSASGERR